MTIRKKLADITLLAIELEPVPAARALKERDGISMHMGGQSIDAEVFHLVKRRGRPVMAIIGPPLTVKR